MAFLFLLRYAQLMPAASDPYVIDLAQAISERHVVYFFTPTIGEATTARQIAGLGLYTAVNAAMQLASGRIRGPLGDELRLTLQEQRLGLSTGAALANLMGRCDTPSMRSFVRSVSQGEALGVSIGAILRNLALETRKRRRAHAEERAQKAPVKILFPLVFLIFPPIFIVVLFPAAHNFTSAFGG